MRSSLVRWAANMLLVTGLVLVVLAGGMLASAEYQRYAARGDSDLPLLVQFHMPFTEAARSSGESTSEAEQSKIERIVIPQIDVDSKVVEVGWKMGRLNGQDMVVWDVAHYAVGHHQGSGNPGEGENIVLAGHVSGYGKVFRDLIEVAPGDEITLYHNQHPYRYRVQEHFLIDEQGLPLEQRQENAHYIEPTGYEVLTLVTCWPPTGNEKFQQRLIVQALPIADE
ncbi:MAG: sortase [Chloroflexaceae bacterium]|nr:sortase [Chloroflexaceae bacterium]